MKPRICLPALLLVAVAAPLAPTAEPDVAGVEFFEKKVRPILVQHCYGCHSAEAEKTKKLRGGLFLDSRAGLLKGGDSGPAVVPGKPAEGTLLEALRHTGDVRMPPRGKLPDAVLADFQAWVKRGAPDPRRPAVVQARIIDIAEGRKFWAYRTPRKSSLPAVKDAAWPANDIDRFVLAALEARGLRPAADADRATLARRLYYDLTGLPPTPEEIDAFVADTSPQAAEQLVERLLAAPAFGERWGRHWLDVARFGESLTLRGFILPEAWRYRDYVIAAFNDDMPFDQFVREQVAGDLLPARTVSDRRRQLIATTFLTLGNTNLEEQDKKQLRMDVVDEQLDTIGKVFLAQTIGCARCHDHKFDPIPTRDYYALAGILRNTQAMEHANVSKWLEVPLPGDPALEAEYRRHEQTVAALEARVKAERGRQQTRDSLRKLEEELKRVRASVPKRDRVMTVLEEKVIEDARVHVRGSVHSLGEPAPRGFLRVATRSPTPALPAGASGRRQLADWLAGSDNPLTARVLANRAWHWLFGAGLVRTTDNFGATGELPSHPELLDYLACRIVEDGWSVKKLVRQLLLSRAYRQSTTAEPEVLAADPENRLLGRRNSRRLEAECIRDTMLAVSGQLRRDAGGPTYRANLAADYGYRHADARRSVYAPVFRNALPELFEVFDFADPSVCTGRRNVSTVAPQALYLMNHPFVVEQSRHAATRLLAEPGLDEPGRITRAYRLALGRPPTGAERDLARRFLDGSAGSWALFFQALFASADFRYVR